MKKNSKVSRRSFLKSAAIATAPMILPSRILFGATTPSNRRQPQCPIR